MSQTTLLSVVVGAALAALTATLILKALGTQSAAAIGGGVGGAVAGVIATRRGQKC